MGIFKHLWRKVTGEAEKAMLSALLPTWWDLKTAAAIVKELRKVAVSVCVESR